MVHKILDNGVVREMTAEETILRDNEIASDEQKLIQKILVLRLIKSNTQNNK